MLGELLLQLGDLAVAQLGGALQVGFALGSLGLDTRLLQAFLGLAHTLDRLLLLLPLRPHLVRASRATRPAQTSIASRRSLEASSFSLRRRRELDLQLHHAPVHLVDLGGHRVDLDAHPRGGLVDQVDRLVGQEAVGDVAMGERGGGDQRVVLDAHTVVGLIALLQPAQDRDRVLHARLAHHHRLEAALQGRVLLDVLAVLVERGGAHAAQLATREHRLEQVGGVHRALGGAGADDRVQLVEEQDDGALRL